MPTSPLTKARERLKTIAEALDPFADACELLADAGAADLACWTRYAPGEFRFLAIGESLLTYAGIESPLAIHAYLYAAISPDATALDGLVTQLKLAWRDNANYPGGELPCTALTFDPCEVLLNDPAAPLVRVHFTLYFPEPYE
jgi:hypothetical protein